MPRDFLLVNNLLAVAYTVSKIWAISGQIFASDTLTPWLGVIPCEYPDELYLFINWNDCPT